MNKLTIKQKKFADEYIISGNATQSYLNAYAKQSRASAEANARKLLANYSVKNYIEERMKQLDDEAIAKQDEILKYLTSVLRGESQSSVVVVEGEGKGYSSARLIEKAPDEKERLKAAELLGKRYGIFTEKQEVNVTSNEKFNDVIEQLGGKGLDEDD